jgi:hypothetical protein
MASYTITTTTAVNVAPNGTGFNSTRVRIVANNACVFAINAAATLTSNVGPMIPANRPVDINMGNIGKAISVLPVGGASTTITATEIGTVYATAIAQNSTQFLNTTAANV